MPTNPLWIEHTEKAAWDTVQALRAQIERSEKELARLKELLDEAKRAHGLKGTNPAELVEELIRLLPPPSPP